MHKIVRFLLVPVRFLIMWRYSGKILLNSLRWLFTSKELSNFTYDLTDLNKKYLASFISVVTGEDLKKIEVYINEIDNDIRLKNFINKKILSSNYRYEADLNASFGRRIGWYAFIRTRKPKVVLETGVDKGMGSIVIALALIKNKKEGFGGIYYGTDINKKSGYLFDKPYNKVGKILYDDSIESLKKITKKIDIFINDSDHAPEYEEKEYATIANNLASDAIIIGDNAHGTSKLFEFARKTDRSFLFFNEKPKAHWYPGAGIGVAFKKNTNGKKKQ